MTTYVGASEAARMLGVTKPTLYAYVSRGLIARRTAVDGRTSLYDRDELERLASRSRNRPPVERPSIDVRIGSAITQLSDERLAYRGHPVDELALSATFEQVADLLWSGELPSEAARWPIDRNDLAACVEVVRAAGVRDPIVALALCASTLAGRPRESGPPDAARRFLAVVPTVLGGPRRGTIAERLAAAWKRRPPDEFVAAVSCALVLLADHELATSTLAVRVAASVRTDPMSAVAAGLATVRGPLHGGASRAATAFLREAEAVGPPAAFARRRAARERLPGFGHTVYRSGDPRVAPLLDAVRAIPASPERMEVVDSVLVEAGRTIGHLPNVDLALGALFFVGGCPDDVPLFGVARTAGWIAHFIEELDARPVRYRGLATRVES